MVVSGVGRGMAQCVGCAMAARKTHSGVFLRALLIQCRLGKQSDSNSLVLEVVPAEGTALWLPQERWPQQLFHGETDGREQAG